MVSSESPEPPGVGGLRCAVHGLYYSRHSVNVNTPAPHFLIDAGQRSIVIARIGPALGTLVDLPLGLPLITAAAGLQLVGAAGAAAGGGLACGLGGRFAHHCPPGVRLRLVV